MSKYGLHCVVVVLHGVQLNAATSQQDRMTSGDVRARLDELTEENRSLKRSLTDAQTTLALQRSEVATIKAQWEEKCYELNKYHFTHSVVF